MFKNGLLHIVVFALCITLFTACTKASGDSSHPTASPASLLASEEQPSDAQQSSKKSQDPGQLTYTIHGEKFTLKGGKFERKEDPAEGWVVENPITTVTLVAQISGNLHGEATDDYAVVLNYDPPGTLNALYIAAVVDHQPTNTIILGDRPTLESFSIEDKKIIISYRDPMNQADVNAEAPLVRKVYHVNDKLELEEVKS